MTQRSLPGYRFFSIITCIWLIFLTILLLLPGSDLPTLSFKFFMPLDKVFHVTALMISSFLLMMSIPGKNKLTLFILTGLAAYSILIEFAQSWLHAGRTFELLDIIANLSGIILGFLLFKWLGKHIRK